MTAPDGRRAGPARSRLGAVPPPVLFVASGLTQYAGAALAVSLFVVIPATSLAWARVAVAGALLVLWRRPWRERWTGASLRAALAFGLVLTVMNVAFYAAIDRLPLGTAVAIEFLGPVTVAAVTGRGARERVGIVLALLGVVLLSGASLDAGPEAVAGLVAIGVAAACWAGYVLLGRHVAQPGGGGISALAVGMAAGALLLSPVLAAGAAPVLTDASLALLVVAIAVCSSLVPYVLEQLVLRRVTAATFAVLLALLPATAALVGAVALQQVPSPAELAGLLLVSSAIALTGRATPRRDGPPVGPSAAPPAVPAAEPPVCLRTGPPVRLPPGDGRPTRPGRAGDTVALMAWLSTPAHARWLESETDRLLEFGRESALASGGFARLDEQGEPQDGPAELWITCRMTHVYALGTLLGRPGSAALVDHGLAALRGAFHDDEHGGWFAEVDADGAPVGAGAKAAYPHAFVVLASASAAVAGRPGALDVLEEALAVSADRFWDEEAGMAVEEWDRTFTTLDPYRGVNANMHTVEAYLAAADVTGDRIWLDRAVRIAGRVVDLARANEWRIPEHFDADWVADLEYNADAPADPFRPYGATIGHWLEWARLLLHARAALTALGDDAPGWMLEAAVALFDASVREGWAVDGADGFVYTVDWSGAPVVRERMHWVAAEAVGAAAALHAATGELRYDHWYSTWWDYIGAYVIDHENGSWWHELDDRHEVSRTVWAGKADLYHAVQATLIPRLPLTPVLAPALARGLLG